MTIGISRQLREILLEEVRLAGAQECCGLLLGDDRTILEVCPADNVSASPETGFEIDPAVLFAAQKAERSGGLRLIGYYHSHPNGSPMPSPRDAERAQRDGRIWMILVEGELRLWRAVADGGLHGCFDALAMETF